jgi:hypothetical protein
MLNTQLNENASYTYNQEQAYDSVPNIADLHLTDQANIIQADLNNEQNMADLNINGFYDSVTTQNISPPFLQHNGDHEEEYSIPDVTKPVNDNSDEEEKIDT